MLFVEQDHALGGEAVPQGIAAGDRAVGLGGRPVLSRALRRLA
jgi:hypothetical protein